MQLSIPFLSINLAAVKNTISFEFFLNNCCPREKTPGVKIQILSISETKGVNKLAV